MIAIAFKILAACLIAYVVVAVLLLAFAVLIYAVVGLMEFWDWLTN